MSLGLKKKNNSRTITKVLWGEGSYFRACQVTSFFNLVYNEFLTSNNIRQYCITSSVNMLLGELFLTPGTPVVCVELLTACVINTPVMVFVLSSPCLPGSLTRWQCLSCHLPDNHATGDRVCRVLSLIIQRQVSVCHVISVITQRQVTQCVSCYLPDNLATDDSACCAISLWPGDRWQRLSCYLPGICAQQVGVSVVIFRR